ncbi:MAG TPA: tetratricopeptide repeat protein [Chloroflexia bacterium]|nr:tetratricopeptide repeat protein [Chloroflexia bacterium]
MKFSFFKRDDSALSEQLRDTANREEFENLAEEVRSVFSRAVSQPLDALESIRTLVKKVRRARTLDRKQRSIINGYIFDATGYAYLELNKPGEALAYLKKAARVYTSLPDRLPLVNNLLSQARAVMLRNNLPEAMALMEKSLDTAREGRLSQLEADVLYRIGVLYSLTGEEDKALEIFGRGLLLAQQTGNTQASANFLSRFGQHYLQQGEMEKAGDYLERSRAIFEESADLDNMMVIYGQLDQYYRQTKELEKALEYANQGLELARGQNNTSEESIFLQDLARIYLEKVDYAPALEHARQSFELAESLGDRDHQLRALELLAQITTQQADYSAAQGWLEKAYSLTKNSKNRRELALILNDYADLRLAQGDARAALGYFEELAAVFKELKDLPTLTTLYVRMGDVYLENLKDPDLAAKMAFQAFELVFSQDSEAGLFAFTSAMRLIQLMAERNYYSQGLAVAGECLEQANATLNRKDRQKRGPAQQSRFLLFVQVLIVLVATLQDLKTGTRTYQGKVKEILGQLTERFGDTFTLDSWTGQMYERLD